MKKSLLALAAMGAFAGAAQAQSSVTVYGLIDMGFKSVTTNTTVRTTGATTDATVTESGAQGQMSGSRIGFRGVEDLGGGNSAGFTLEMGPDFTERVNGINTGTRLGFLSLSNKQIGGLHVGRQVSSTKTVNDAFTAFGNANFANGSVTGVDSPTATINQLTANVSTAAISKFATQGSLGNNNGGERISNLIRYTTPTFSGISASAGAFKTTTTAAVTQSAFPGGAEGEGQDYGIRFTQGAIDAMAAYTVYNTTNGTTADLTTKTSVMSLGASYDAKVVKGFVTYNKRDHDVPGAAVGIVKFTDVTVGINVPVGKTNLLVAYGSGTDESNTIKNDKSGFQVGAVHNLSKRTNIYAAYGAGKVEISTGTPTNSKVTDSGMTAGIRHTF
jgi:predicted porin